MRIYTHLFGSPVPREECYDDISSGKWRERESERVRKRRELSLLHLSLSISPSLTHADAAEEMFGMRAIRILEDHRQEYAYICEWTDLIFDPMSGGTVLCS